MRARIAVGSVAAGQNRPEALATRNRRFRVFQLILREDVPRLRTGRDGAPGLAVDGAGVQSTLQARYENAIAGVSFDNVSGHWVVDATQSVPASAIAAVFARTGLSGSYRLDRVAYTDADHAGLLARKPRGPDDVGQLLGHLLQHLGGWRCLLGQ